ncbi:MAG: inositol monophosphatase [Nitrospinae bacterium]|nr:inositol monophosphatase [Nitrospinota bacterium]
MKNEVNLSDALAVAQQAAREAGRIMTEMAERGFRVEHKGEIDLVTEVDVLCEKAVEGILGASFPGYGILGEEYANVQSGAKYKWVIDPIDGTTNYAHGFPVYCSSVALTLDGAPIVGAVYDPTRDEMFCAVQGMGAMLNGYPIRVSHTAELIKSLLATGFPYDIKTTPRNNLKQFADFAMRAQAIRRPGAAALDLCYVAAGRMDGFWEFHLKPWDIAAGALIVAEAGGTVTMSGGEELDIYRSDIVASNGIIHKEMLEVLGMR